MKILLTSAYDYHPCLDALREAAAMVRGSSLHELCDSPESADAILFVENTHFDDLGWTQLLRHPMLKRHRGKSFLYNESDKPWDALAGLYCSLPPSEFASDRHVPFPYIGIPRPSAEAVPADRHEPRWLYSFMGSMSHSCRRAIMQLDDPAARLVDTSNFDVWHADEDERVARAQDFARSLTESAFVLCPRGIGTSSMRLFETMEVGRVPVIIADDWLAPPHVDWSFALRVPERHIHDLPVLIRAHASEAVERGQAASDAWRARYAPDALFDTVGESLSYLLAGVRGRRRHPYTFVFRKWLLTGEAATREALRRLRRAA